MLGCELSTLFHFISVKCLKSSVSRVSQWGVEILKIERFLIEFRLMKFSFHYIIIIYSCYKSTLLHTYPEPSNSSLRLEIYINPKTILCKALERPCRKIAAFGVHQITGGCWPCWCKHHHQSQTDLCTYWTESHRHKNESQKHHPLK